MNNFFKLFACCIPVKGARRSIICDLQRNNYEFIPNDLYSILTDCKGKSIEDIKIIYRNQYDKIVDDYFQFLIEKEFGFFCDNTELDSFPEINLKWDEPRLITNAIIDININSNHDYKQIFDELEDLGCQHIQVRSYCEKSINFFDGIVSKLDNSRIHTLEIITKFYSDINISDIERLLKRYPRINNFIVHSSPFIKIHKTDVNSIGNIVFSSDIINSNSHCGIISSSYFSINIKLFTEGQEHNTCLNRKISLDENGDIKNCPSMANTFGNIKSTSLKDAIAQKDFKQVWFINKEQIEICKDCEFRYICTDCRAFRSDMNNMYSKPMKCAYDPYSAVWND